MKKKVIKVIAVLAALIIIAIAAMLILFAKKPNLLFGLFAEEITEGQVKEITFEYEYDEDSEDDKAFYDGFPIFKFKAPESASYTVSVSDVKSDADVFVNLSIMDENLEDFAAADNFDRKMDGLTDSAALSASLQESQQSYILVEAGPGNESVKKYSGSLKLTVTKDPEEEKPPEIKIGESVTLKVEADSQSCAVFTPEETGYYRFGTSIKNSRAAGGYSAVSSVTSQDNLGIELTDGICKLEQGKEYYVWVSVYETSNRRSRVRVTCTGMKTESAAEKGEIHITGDTVIEYMPAVSGNIAVYSVTDGDPRTVIYEKAGFPLRTDDDTEASLSENPNDFAVVFTAEAGGAYRICVFGDFAEGSVIITDYTGDGSSLTPDDIAPLEKNQSGSEGTEQNDEHPVDSEDAESGDESTSAPEE